MKGQWGKLVGWFVGVAIVSSLVTFGLPLIGGGSWLPELIADEGSPIDELFWGLMILSIVIFALVGALVLFSMKHFRAAPGDMSDGEYIHGNAKLEMVWVIVPTIIVFVVGILSYIVLEDIEVGLYKKAKASEAAMAADMQVDVRAFSFGWNFRYMDKAGKPLGAADAEPTTELIVPMNKTIKFDVISCSGKEHLGRLQEETFRTLRTHGKENEFAEIEPSICEKEWDLTTKEQQADIVKQTTALYKAEKARADGKKLSEEQQALIDAQPRFRGDQQFMDVNHAFWVPESRLKIDAVAGLPTLVQWTPNTLTSPDEPIQVVCAELCGAGHNGMRTQVCVIDQATFDWWVELDTEERKNANCLNLRLMNCLAEDMPSDMNALLESTAELTRTKPDATCKDAEEIAA